VRWALSAHARRLLTLALAGLALAVVTRRPEFAGVAAPALLLLVTWRAARPRTVEVRVGTSVQQAVEGQPVPITVAISGQDGYDAGIELVPAAAITAERGVTIPARSADLAGAVRLRFRPERWGNRHIGTVQVTLRDACRLTEGRVDVELPRVRCAPGPAVLASSIVLSKLPSRLGEHAARATGEGVEFAGVREFVPGDRQRRINWPATTRRGTLHLSTFAAERTQNVVVIADLGADVGEDGFTTLDLVERGAAGTMSRYLTGRDRVGLICVGSGIAWIGPGQGRRHFGRLLDLLVTGPAGLERASAMTRLPRAALPPGALIIAFSPLLDRRLVEAIRDLRERGFSVLVVDVLNSGPDHDGSMLSGLTERVWKLEQQAIRFSLTEIGVPVVHWNGRTTLDEPLAPYTRRAIVVRH
jgi:uncharacterized protein (DUF58 family)